MTEPETRDRILRDMRRRDQARREGYEDGLIEGRRLTIEALGGMIARLALRVRALEDLIADDATRAAREIGPPPRRPTG